MKKLIIFTIMAAMAITSLTACGNNNTTSTSSSAAATSDEAVVEDATIDTLAETDQAVVDSGLTVDDKGNVVDKDGNKVETNADGKVEVKTADGKTKTVNDNKTKIDAANQAPQQTNSRKNSDNATSNSGSSAQTSKSGSAQTSSGSSSVQSSSKSSQTSQSQQSSKTQATTADPHAGKTYHDAVYKTVTHPAETKQIKVVDQEAYSYEEPVYEMKRIHKCKDCGMDLLQLSQSERITHANQHIDAGGDGGWYSTTEQVQVGTKTVNVPEQSHMETVVVKEAWTEQVLVKAAGWY